MKGLLLDSHVLIWWFIDSPRLPATLRERILHTKEPVFVSAVTAWELATKHRIGKLPEVSALVAGFGGHVQSQGFVALPISAEHALAAGALDIAHRDPFDRMLIAQAMMENLVLVSNEQIFDGFGVDHLWD